MSKPVDVRNKLADKALELFNANGYEKTSVNSICAAANVSRTRFYSLFSDKKGLDYVDHARRFSGKQY